MKNKNLTGSAKKFQKILKHYMKHKGLQIEVTLKNGENVTIDGNRKLSGNDIVRTDRWGIETFRVDITDIKKADIYAI
ncbi:MAG: hypothetical protein OEZ22_10200 [Spirochaetia bacterium]|nr:hypothetical protein [Spirochaetia bacterium]